MQNDHLQYRTEEYVERISQALISSINWFLTVHKTH